MNKLSIFTCAFIAVLVFFCSLRQVRADRLKLKNGNDISGIVTKEGENYVVEFSTGKMKIHESEVVEVITEETELQKFRKKHARINNSNANAHYELGVWAKTHGLYKQAQEEFRHAIQIDPGHERARRELGYVEHNGQWMTRAEKMRRKGYVKYEGEWMTP
jgi:tetratricopeptide (TPR) repeat protein